MKFTASRMGMPVVIEIVDQNIKQKHIDEVLRFLQEIDDRFSTYKIDSEVEKINRGEINEDSYSQEMKHILKLSERTKEETNGYFNVYHKGKLDPSGIVKGYAINKGSQLLKQSGYDNFYFAIAGDVQVYGFHSENEKWKVGIENPFNRTEIIKIVYLTDCGIATSGTYIRRNHIYDPVTGLKADAIASISVIGPTVYDADRMATAAFAMGEKGIQFIEKLPGYEGYMVTKEKRGVMTSGFEKFLS